MSATALFFGLTYVVNDLNAFQIFGQFSPSRFLAIVRRYGRCGRRFNQIRLIGDDLSEPVSKKRTLIRRSSV
jgi:hypothetical protein